jgi:hypothetical protein
MQRSMQVFLRQLLDYAGMFPPAKLPLREALHNYLHYRRTSPQAWMLGRFICPVGQLAEVSHEVRLPPDAELLSISALGRQSAKADEVLTTFDADLRAIQDFRRARGSESVVDTVELALPKEAPLEPLLAVLAPLQKRLEETKLRGFLEMTLQSSWRDRVVAISQTLRSQSAIGLKLRCGGTTPELFPCNEDVAHFILSCRDAQLSWKATAGLHHPHRFWDAPLHLWHHGFLNVFGAGALALSQPLCEADVTAILADRLCEHLHFDETGLRWKEWSCSVARLQEIRSKWLTSFGTCSFEEPVQDLTSLGLL